jgi:hypothetical protein
MIEIPRHIQDMMRGRESQVKEATQELKERRAQAMKDHPDYQRKQRLGEDGRIREAIEIQSKHIHERNQYAEACPSYNEAREQAARNAEMMVRKRSGG